MFSTTISLVLCLLIYGQETSGQELNVVGSISDKYTPIIVTEDTLQAALNFFDNILVEYCENCEEFANDHMDISTIIKNSSNEKVLCVQVNVQGRQDLLDRFDFKKLPTFKLFRKNGIVQELTYRGYLSVLPIAEWVLKKIESSVVKLEDKESALKLVQTNQDIYVGYFKDEASKDALAYLEQTELDDTNRYAITFKEDIARGIGLYEEGVRLFKRMDTFINIGPLFDPKFYNIVLLQLLEIGHYLFVFNVNFYSRLIPILLAEIRQTLIQFGRLWMCWYR